MLNQIIAASSSVFSTLSGSSCPELQAGVLPSCPWKLNLGPSAFQADALTTETFCLAVPTIRLLGQECPVLV